MEEHFELFAFMTIATGVCLHFCGESRISVILLSPRRLEKMALRTGLMAISEK